MCMCERTNESFDIGIDKYSMPHLLIHHKTEDFFPCFK